MKLKKIARNLKIFSISRALLGGILLASKILISSYRFIFPALSSSNLLIASIQDNDTTKSIYAASIFIFVDYLGIYR